MLHVYFFRVDFFCIYSETISQLKYFMYQSQEIAGALCIARADGSRTRLFRVLTPKHNQTLESICHITCANISFYTIYSSRIRVYSAHLS